MQNLVTKLGHRSHDLTFQPFINRLWRQNLKFVIQNLAISKNQGMKAVWCYKHPTQVWSLILSSDRYGKVIIRK